MPPKQILVLAVLLVAVISVFASAAPQCTRFATPESTGRTQLPCGHDEFSPCFGLSSATTLANLSSWDVVCLLPGPYALDQTTPLQLPQGVIILGLPDGLRAVTISPKNANVAWPAGSVFQLIGPTVAPDAANVTQFIDIEFRDFVFSAGDDSLAYPPPATLLAANFSGAAEAPKIQFLRVQFTNNKVIGGEALLDIAYATLELVESTVDSNSLTAPTGSVGIVSCVYCDLITLDSDFTNNMVTTTASNFDTPAAFVGVLFVEGKASVDKSTFKNNTGSLSNDVAVLGSVSSEESVFNSPRPFADLSPSILSNALTFISNCTFNSTTVSYAIFVLGGELAVYNSDFRNALIYTNDSQVVIKDSAFVWDTVDRGYMIQIEKHSPQIEQSTFTSLVSREQAHVHNNYTGADLTMEIVPAIYFNYTVGASVRRCSFFSLHNVSVASIAASNYTNETVAFENWFGSERGPESCCTDNSGGVWRIWPGIDFSGWATKPDFSAFSEKNVSETCAKMICDLLPTYGYVLYAVSFGLIAVEAVLMTVLYRKYRMNDVESREALLANDAPDPLPEEVPFTKTTLESSVNSDPGFSAEELSALEQFKHVVYRVKLYGGNAAVLAVVGFGIALYVLLLASRGSDIYFGPFPLQFLLGMNSYYQTAVFFFDLLTYIIFTGLLMCYPKSRIILALSLGRIAYFLLGHLFLLGMGWVLVYKPSTAVYIPPAQVIFVIAQALYTGLCVGAMIFHALGFVNAWRAMSIIDAPILNLLEEQSKLSLTLQKSKQKVYESPTMMRAARPIWVAIALLLVVTILPLFFALAFGYPAQTQQDSPKEADPYWKESIGIVSVVAVMGIITSGFVFLVTLYFYRPTLALLAWILILIDILAVGSLVSALGSAIQVIDKSYTTDVLKHSNIVPIYVIFVVLYLVDLIVIAVLLWRFRSRSIRLLPSIISGNIDKVLRPATFGEDPYRDSSSDTED